MYPCTHCRGHFQKDYEKGTFLFYKDPPNLENQKDLSLWVCRQHNYVNKILGKPQYSCDYEGLMKRWKTGCDFDSYWIVFLSYRINFYYFFTFMNINIIRLFFVSCILRLITCAGSSIEK